jgi:hypothetical protein
MSRGCKVFCNRNGNNWRERYTIYAPGEYWCNVFDGDGHNYIREFPDGGEVVIGYNEYIADVNANVAGRSANGRIVNYNKRWQRENGMEGLWKR